MASRTWSFPLKEKETLLTPPLTFVSGMQAFYFPGGFNKIYCIIIVFFDAGGNGKNVWIKNDILRVA
jgi:hypothetical protein